MDQTTAAADPSSSDPDRLDHESLKRRLRRSLSQQNGHSQSLHDTGCLLRTARDRRFWVLDGLDDFNAYVRAHCGFGEDQARKYLFVADHFSSKELAGRRLGLDSLGLIGGAIDEQVRLALLEAVGAYASEAAIQRAQVAGNRAWRKGLDIPAAIANALSPGSRAPRKPDLTLDAFYSRLSAHIRRQLPRLEKALEQPDRFGAPRPATVERLRSSVGDLSQLLNLLAAPAVPPMGQNQVNSPEPQPIPTDFAEQNGPMAPADKRRLDRDPDPGPEPEPQSVPSSQTDPFEDSDPEPAPPAPPLFNEPLQPGPPAVVDCEIVIGTSGFAEQAGVIGKALALSPSGQVEGAEPVAFDSAGCELLVVTGDIGQGKSTTLGVHVENHTQRRPGLNQLRRPSCALIIDSHTTEERETETSLAVFENRTPHQVRTLIEKYGARPAGWQQLTQFCPAGMVNTCRQRNPFVRTLPLLLNPQKLGSRGWEAVLGIEENNSSLYARKGLALLAQLRDRATVPAFRSLISAEKLPAGTRDRLLERLELAEPFLAPVDYCLTDFARPGAVLTLRVGDRWLRPQQRVMLLSVVLDLLVGQRGESRNGSASHLLLVLDEVKNVLMHDLLARQMDGYVMRRRHLGLSLALGGQDMAELDLPVLSQASQVVMHGAQGEENLKRFQKALRAFGVVTKGMVARLGRGRALVWGAGGVLGPQVAHFLEVPRLMEVRPMTAQPGGETRTALGSQLDPWLQGLLPSW